MNRKGLALEPVPNWVIIGFIIMLLIGVGVVINEDMKELGMFDEGCHPNNSADGPIGFLEYCPIEGSRENCTLVDECSWDFDRNLPKWASNDAKEGR